MLKKNKNKKLILIIFLAIFSLPLAVKADSLIDLQKKASELETQIDKYQDNIVSKQKQAQTLKRDLSILDSEISQAKLKIQQTEVAIQLTEFDIDKKENQIQDLDQKIINQKNTLAQNIRTVHYYDQESLLEILLSTEDLSDVLSRVQALEVLQKEIQESLDIIRANKDLTTEDKVKLENKEEEQVSLRKLQESQKRSLQKKEQDKKYILNKTQGEETKYKKLLSQKEVELRQVKEQITLLQSKGQQVLDLDEWIKISQKAEKLTGVDAALLMAVLDQETDLGRFLGGCNYKDALRGSHAYSKSIFENICQDLNLDPNKELVSCPLKNSKGQYVGSGGAMGPAQFMPATWKSIKSELENLLGYTANPWMPDDAITAMALYLRQNGALTSWRRAAGAYFGKCTFYGVDYCDDVVDLAKEYQKVIDQRS